MTKLKIEFEDFKKEVEIPNQWCIIDAFHDLSMELAYYIKEKYPELEGDDFENSFIGWD